MVTYSISIDVPEHQAKKLLKNPERFSNELSDLCPACEETCPIAQDPEFEVDAE